MTDPQPPFLPVQQARELFFGQGCDEAEAAGIAPYIARSWRRCRDGLASVVDADPLAGAVLGERRENAIQMLACAQPELESLAEHAVRAGCVVILSDPSGLILEEIGSPEFLPKAQRIALAPGMEWSEQSRGTNAIGTALTERQALMVLGGEHYLPQNGGIGCAAAPIFTGRGEVAGVLDISGDTGQINGHTLGLVRMAAQQVEHRLLLANASGHLLRFHAKPGLLGSAREGLLMIEDGRITAANRVALDLLSTHWGQVIDQFAATLIGERWTRLQKQTGLITLPSGRQIAAVMERANPPRSGGVARTGRAVAPPTEAPACADALATALERAVKVLNAGLSVLVTGETGSGKEVFARRLHQASRRATGPFVAVNCAALPESLIEAELFGYEAGAFTGAQRRGMPGRIREAEGGVLFLDEIGDMPLSLQPRLLRVLEDHVVVPLGGGPGVKVDFDLVCATHQNIGDPAASERFRTDLLYRVDAFRVDLPPLRERPDRRALIQRLFDQAAAAKRLVLEEAVLDVLDGHAWPGNVRELNSVLRAMVALAEPHECITLGCLPARLAERADERAAQALATEHATAAELSEMVQDAFDQVWAECHGNASEAARRLGVHRSTVYRRLRQARKPPR